MKQKGLGDTVDWITTHTGIKQAVKYFFGDNCGCQERKEWLNKMLPYMREELTQSEYLLLHDFFKEDHSTVTAKQQSQLLKIYNRVFGKRREMSSCSPCVKTLVDELKELYNEYSKAIEQSNKRKA